MILIALGEYDIERSDQRYGIEFPDFESLLRSRSVASDNVNRERKSARSRQQSNPEQK
jgi:hypothetical protein